MKFSFKFCRIDGSTSLLDRETQMNDFNAEDSKLFIFLLSTRSGGLGINLTAADTVILYDSDWNPQMDLQAMDRAHRIGQKNIVNVYRFITKGTVEERLNEKQLYKLKWDSLIVRNNKERSNNHFSKEDFNKMIDFGVSEIFASEKGTYTDEDIDLILRRGEEKAEENSKKLEEYFKKHKDLLNLTKPEDDYSLYNFNDINYSKIRNQDLKIINELRKEEFTKSEPQSTRKRMLLLSNSSETNMENLSLEEIQKLQNIQNKVVKRFPIHHFYENRDRLIDLESKQIAYSIYNQKNKLDENLLMLEPSEIEEKNKLIQTGFTNWTHSDIKGLLQAFDKFQKNDFKGIAKVKNKNFNSCKNDSYILHEIVYRKKKRGGN